ncbi:MAG: iron-sulfur cluster assembly accessory protein [Bacteroidia bacterium]|nr:iron-sulfur cluster assembly accessory protein [Bacteroidia bacterium]
MQVDAGSITITEKALWKAKELMREASISSPEYFMRVGVKGGGCSGLSYELDFDNESKPGDMDFGDDQLRIVCDMKSFLYLCGTELDFTDGLNGKGFNFINPNATRTCGCGESFAV